MMMMKLEKRRCLPSQVSGITDSLHWSTSTEVELFHKELHFYLVSNFMVNGTKHDLGSGRRFCIQ